MALAPALRSTTSNVGISPARNEPAGFRSSCSMCEACDPGRSPPSDVHGQGRSARFHAPLPTDPKLESLGGRENAHRNSHALWARCARWGSFSRQWLAPGKRFAGRLPRIPERLAYKVCGANVDTTAPGSDSAANGDGRHMSPKTIIKQTEQQTLTFPNISRIFNIGRTE